MQLWNKIYPTVVVIVIFVAMGLLNGALNPR